MHITIIMVVTYILCCVRIGTAPWRYWQLNAHYFSAKHGIFSKFSIDRLIPKRWRLAQHLDSDALEPASFPVFLKPEWGQNAHGIHRVDSQEQLEELRVTLAGQQQRYLVQEAAPGRREFELFSIDANREDEHHDVFTITEAVNNSESFPINSKFNRNTRYVDITDKFDEQQRLQLMKYLSKIGKFGISRMSVRADDLQDLVDGKFHVIEINLFVPMPINLLDTRLSLLEKWRFIRPAMMSLAQSTKLIKPVKRPQPIFTRMMTYGRRRERKADVAQSGNANRNKLGGRYSQPRH